MWVYLSSPRKICTHKLVNHPIQQLSNLRIGQMSCLSDWSCLLSDLMVKCLTEIVNCFVVILLFVKCLIEIGNCTGRICQTSDWNCQMSDLKLFRCPLEILLRSWKLKNIEKIFLKSGKNLFLQSGLRNLIHFSKWWTETAAWWLTATGGASRGREEPLSQLIKLRKLKGQNCRAVCAPENANCTPSCMPN